MTETLFERYKEALRAGHVAVVRGRLEEAAAAYRDAIAIAGDRAVPRSALGGVLLRLGDPAAALEAYEGALALAPDDDAALLGRAQSLVVLRRTADAAATYDRLAEVRETAGREGDAAEAARRALAIEPTDDRRRRHDALAGGDRPLGAVETEPEPEPPPPPPIDAEALVMEAEDALAADDREAAAAAALAAARAYADQARHVAAVDACLLGIQARPADADLHLLLATLTAGRVGAAHAADAHQRLLRLVELDGDAAAVERVRAAGVPAGAIAVDEAPRR